MIKSCDDLVRELIFSVEKKQALEVVVCIFAKKLPLTLFQDMSSGKSDETRR